MATARAFQGIQPAPSQSPAAIAATGKAHQVNTGIQSPTQRGHCFTLTSTGPSLQRLCMGLAKSPSQPPAAKRTRHGLAGLAATGKAHQVNIGGHCVTVTGNGLPPAAKRTRHGQRCSMSRACVPACACSFHASFSGIVINRISTICKR